MAFINWPQHRNSNMNLRSQQVQRYQFATYGLCFTGTHLVAFHLLKHSLYTFYEKARVRTKREKRSQMDFLTFLISAFTVTLLRLPVSFFVSAIIRFLLFVGRKVIMGENSEYTLYVPRDSVEPCFIR
jgi:hypothetical protein